MPDPALLAKMGELERLDKGVPNPARQPWNIMGVTWNEMQDNVDDGPERERPIGHYTQEIIDSLPLRTGKNRDDTAKYLLTELARNPKASSFTAIRAMVVERLDSYSSYDQEFLLRNYWSALKGPDLLPALEHICAEGTDPAAVQRLVAPISKDDRHYWVEQIQKTTELALKRLGELSPEAVKPFLLKDLRISALPVTPERAVGNGSAIENVQAELDTILLGQIRATATVSRAEPPRTQKMEYAALFASPAIYDPMFDLYRQSNANWWGEERGAMLAYLLRWNDERAMPLFLQAADSEANLYQVLGPIGDVYSERKQPFPPAVRAYLREIVADGSEGNAAVAAGQLSSHGLPEDADALRSRLETLQRTWRSKSDELSKMPMAKDAASALNLERSLINALRIETWRPSEAELLGLKTHCLGAVCAHMKVMPLAVEPAR